MGEFSGFQVKKDETFEQVVVENQVNIEILGFGADTHLASDEGKALAQFQQKGLQLIDEGLFQISLQQSAGFWQAEKLQQHRVTHELTRRLLQGGHLRGGFLTHGVSVAAGEQALVIQRADLPVQCAGAPILVRSFVHVPVPGLFAIYAQ